MTDFPARFRLGELLELHKPEPMSQAELSRLSGVSPVTINRIAQNRTKQVSLRTLEKLSAVLGCEPGDLIVSAKPKRSKR